MPDLLTIALGVLFAAGTLLHTFKALEKKKQPLTMLTTK